jgi:hypothetical protein
LADGGGKPLDLARLVGAESVRSAVSRSIIASISFA